VKRWCAARGHNDTGADMSIYIVRFAASLAYLRSDQPYRICVLAPLIGRQAYGRLTGAHYHTKLLMFHIGRETCSRWQKELVRLERHVHKGVDSRKRQEMNLISMRCWTGVSRFGRKDMGRPLRNKGMWLPHLGRRAQSNSQRFR